MNKKLFLSLSLLTGLFGYLSNLILNFDVLLVNSVTEQLTKNQIGEFIEFREDWEWVGYLLILILIFFKISAVSAILDAGCFFFDKEIKYKTLFNIVVKAEFIFLLVIIFKTIWFYVFQQNYTLKDLQSFYPLSAINVTGYEGLKPWFIYPLQVLNLFEVAYWFILAYLLGKELNITTNKGFSIVATSYGVGLLIWVVAVMFFTLNMS